MQEKTTTVSGLNVNDQNANTSRKNLVSNVRKMLSEKPDITDTEFEQEINTMMNLNSKINTSDDNNSLRMNYGGHLYMPSMFTYSSIFDAIDKKLNKSFDRFNKMSELMNTEFGDISVDNNYTSEPQSYTKYVKSITTYNNGIKKAKTITGTEKISNGKRTVHKKLITEDENGKVIEETLPNGTKRIIKTDSNLLTNVN